MIALATATLDAAEIDDLHAVCRSSPEYWRQSGELDPDSMSREDVAAMLREEAGVPGAELLLAGDDSGRTVGFAAVLGEHPVDGHPWIGLLLVDGRISRHGYGRAIVTALEQRFRGEGRVALRLAVLENNPGAQAFWTVLGYRPIDRRPDRDQGRPAIVMHKDLHGDPHRAP